MWLDRVVVVSFLPDAICPTVAPSCTSFVTEVVTSSCLAQPPIRTPSIQLEDSSASCSARFQKWLHPAIQSTIHHLWRTLRAPLRKRQQLRATAAAPEPLPDSRQVRKPPLAWRPKR